MTPQRYKDIVNAFNEKRQGIHAIGTPYSVIQELIEYIDQLHILVGDGSQMPLGVMDMNRRKVVLRTNDPPAV